VKASNAGLTRIVRREQPREGLTMGGGIPQA